MQQTLRPDTPYLKYMGTPATVRDLVALADYLQGPGTPINFMGISHGSLIGSYLINSENWIVLFLCRVELTFFPVFPEVHSPIILV